MKKRTPKEILADKIERLNIQETWRDRLNKLPTSRRAFAAKHNLNTSVLCRYEKCTMAAGWDWINRVESALSQELGE